MADRQDIMKLVAQNAAHTWPLCWCGEQHTKPRVSYGSKETTMTAEEFQMSDEWSQSGLRPDYSWFAFAEAYAAMVTRRVTEERDTAVSAYKAIRNTEPKHCEHCTCVCTACGLEWLNERQ